MAKIAAFFDLDRTLIDVNSAILYAKYERQRKRITIRQLVEALINTGLYHLNLLDMETAYLKACQHYVGKSEATIESNTRRFFKKTVSKRLRKGAQSALKHHRQLGHSLVLLSSTSSYQAKIASEFWGLDHCIANEFPTKNGRLTGEIVKPLCYHSGKVARAETWAGRHSIDLNDCFFYSDSYSDLPMLERVGNPRIVNPDPKLKRYSQKVRWPVLDWSK